MTDSEMWQEYVEVVADCLDPADDQEPVDSPTSPEDAVRPSATLALETTQDCSNLYTAWGRQPRVLRPISEISELYHMDLAPPSEGQDVLASSGLRRSERTENKCRNETASVADRPSATDSGHPSSPGCSFEGSSDSVDSRCSSTGVATAASSACVASDTSATASTGSVFAPPPAVAQCVPLNELSRLKRHSDPSGEPSYYQFAGESLSTFFWQILLS